MTEKLRTVQEVAQEIIDGDEVSVEPILREWAEEIIACVHRCAGHNDQPGCWSGRTRRDLGLDR